MSCCARPMHVISVRTDSGALSMLRCPACGRQVWAQDGIVVARDDAFAHLAQVFQARTVLAHEARRSTASEAARRAADREAAGTAAAKVKAATPTRRPSLDLVDLLTGWQVLGVSS